MARDNYSYRKYQKELKKKKKNEKKQQRKLDKKNIQEKADSAQTSNQGVPLEAQEQEPLKE